MNLNTAGLVRLNSDSSNPKMTPMWHQKMKFYRLLKQSSSVPYYLHVDGDVLHNIAQIYIIWTAAIQVPSLNEIT